MKRKFLDDVEHVMRVASDTLAGVTGNEDLHKSATKLVVESTDERKNEAVILCWSAVSAEDEVENDDDLSSGMLMAGTSSLAVNGAMILGMCERLIRVGIQTGAFPDAGAPVLVLANALQDEFSAVRRGHA